MWARAYAKINLSLQVRPRRDDGLHELRSLMQSVSWSDGLGLDEAEVDSFEAKGAVPGDHTNLALGALTSIRQVAGVTAKATLSLAKAIPVSAGLGGGSADAAAVLRLAARMWGIEDSLQQSVAPSLGSDVRFCLTGGTAFVTGGGEAVELLQPRAGFSLGVVVPPIELSTAAVYRTWDELGGPPGGRLEESDLPPQIRGLGPFTNDLYRAAAYLARDIDDWRAELAALWSRPVMLSGSGPALFAYFMDEEEAGQAMRALPPGARAAQAASPVSVGSEIGEGTLPDRWGVV